MQKEEYLEKEIDLRELLLSIWKKKLFIIIFTGILTSLAIFYVYTKTPIYKASALIEIGSYKTDSGTLLLDDSSNLSQKLNVLYIDLFKNKKERSSQITNISVPKRAKEFIEITSEATSNDFAIQEIKNVVSYIQEKHKKILDEANNKRELSLKNVVNKIKSLNEIEIPSYKQSIEDQENILSTYQNELLNVNKIIKEIEKKDSSLTALKLMEKSQILDAITKLEIQLFEIKSKFNNIITNKLTSLEESKKQISSLLLDYNYKNSNIVGEVIITDHPIKPNKKIIVVVTFAIGFILSIFIVFFISFITGIKNESKKEEA